VSILIFLVDLVRAMLLRNAPKYGAECRRATNAVEDLPRMLCSA
jgi:hypothetical protein